MQAGEFPGAQSSEDQHDDGGLGPQQLRERAVRRLDPVEGHPVAEEHNKSADSPEGDLDGGRRESRRQHRRERDFGVEPRCSTSRWDSCFGKRSRRRKWAREMLGLLLDRSVAGSCGGCRRKSGGVSGWWYKGRNGRF